MDGHVLLSSLGVGDGDSGSDCMGMVSGNGVLDRPARTSDGHDNWGRHYPIFHTNLDLHVHVLLTETVRRLAG